MVGVRYNGSLFEAYTYLNPQDLHGPRHGDITNRAHKCRNGKIGHIHIGLAPCPRPSRLAHMVYEARGRICIIHMPYMIYWSTRPACTGGLNIVHGGQKILYYSPNGQKRPHS